jgi:2-polyprenyl-3-methyl-5-hydroxy-6-metoxy-1,4-benzoquinol methylase
MQALSASEKDALINRYHAAFAVPPLSYGTVRDYCDSCDYLPCLSNVQGDLKDLQRPWTVKAALGLLPAGSRLLEVGAGRPLVASLLADLEYHVTVIDPYDGSDRGPTEFENFVRLHPNIRIIRDRFRRGLPQLKDETFDGIYSISVLEHIPEPALGEVFRAVSFHLRPRGKSFHSVDCVVEGSGAAFHFEQCSRVAAYQSEIAGKTLFGPAKLIELFAEADRDLETCYLSAAGHNLWRAGAVYDTFPFRKVLSFQTAVEANEST